MLLNHSTGSIDTVEPLHVLGPPNWYERHRLNWFSLLYEQTKKSGMKKKVRRFFVRTKILHLYFSSRRRFFVFIFRPDEDSSSLFFALNLRYFFVHSYRRVLQLRKWMRGLCTDQGEKLSNDNTPGSAAMLTSMMRDAGTGAVPTFFSTMSGPF